MRRLLTVALVLSLLVALSSVPAAAQEPVPELVLAVVPE